MKRWTLSRLILIAGGSLLLWGVAAALCLLAGSTGFGWPGAEVLPLRREAVIIASIVGAALSSAGVVYQAILRNPLAEPYLLGVSGGASLGLYLWILPFAAASPLLGSLSQQTFAFAGAVAALLFVLVLAQRRGRIEPVTILLVGVIVNSISGAVYMLLDHLNLAHHVAGSGSAFRFLVGSIRTYLTPTQIAVAGFSAAAGWIIILLLSARLNVAMLGEAEAQALGVRIHALRWIALIVASLMTASSVAISGPIGFIGLVCPHLARLMVGNDQRRLLPVATAVGAAVLALADALSRYLAPYTGGPLPVGVLTGLMGGPFFLYLLWRSGKGVYKS